MIEYEIKVDRRTFRKQIDRAKKATVKGTEQTVNHLGELIADEARRVVAVASSDLKDSIHAIKTHVELRTNTVHGGVEATAGHALYVEMGFKAHFVPFHVAESLYAEALHHWGWTLPTPSQIGNRKPGRRYLVPRGKKRAVWGVFVSGKAQPFLRPSAQKIFESHLPVVVATEKLNIEYKKAEAELRMRR